MASPRNWFSLSHPPLYLHLSSGGLLSSRSAAASSWERALYHPLASPSGVFFYVPNESALIRICFNRFTESARRAHRPSALGPPRSTSPLVVLRSFHERRTELFANRTAEYPKYSHYRRGFTAFGRLRDRGFQGGALTDETRWDKNERKRRRRKRGKMEDIENGVLSLRH